MADCGPNIPSHISSVRSKHEETDSENSDDDKLGPKLPSHLRKTSSRRDEKRRSSKKSKHTGHSHGRSRERYSSSKDIAVHDNILGPQLPPHLRKQTSCNDERRRSPVEEDVNFNMGIKDERHYTNSSGAKRDRREWHSTSSRERHHDSQPEHELPRVRHNPSSSKHYLSSSQHQDSSESAQNCSNDDDEGSYGPALPPGFTKTKTILGPSLPPTGLATTGATEVIDEDNDSSGDVDDEIVGPMLPSEKEASLDKTLEDIEARAYRTKMKMTSKKDEKLTRDSWMTELPPEIGKNFGLQARTFKKSVTSCGDRSVWTDTPSERERKSQEKISGKKRAAVKEEDEVKPWELAKAKEMQKQIEKHNKHRTESLLQIHQKDRKKKAKESSEEVEGRRPFDREVDLQSNRLDAAKKRSIIKKSQQLGSRFTHSKGTSSYL